MTITHEVHLDAQGSASASFLFRLKALGRWLIRLPGLHLLKPLARRALAVAEPAGRMFLRHAPVRSASGANAGHTLTALSANLWHDWPRRRDLLERLESFAQLVEAEKADVVLLQEVSRTGELRVDEWLARRLGMAYAYSRANGHEAAIGFEEGLAVFSRFPLLKPHLRQLGIGRNPFVRRLALGVTVDAPGGNLLAFSVHLGLRRRHNALQLSHLREWVAEVAGPRPALIGGDFNASERSRQIVSTQRTWLDIFRHLHPQADGTTHELRWPWGGLLRRHRLDYIFLHAGERCWNVLEARHVDAPGGPHSDHRAVLVRLAPCRHE